MSDYAGRKILVVEDQPQMRMLISMVLKKMGVEKVIEVGDGSEALDFLEKSDGDGIDMVIADWNMPEVSGIELLKRIRSHQLYQNLPYLMVTCLDEGTMCFSSTPRGSYRLFGQALLKRGAGGKSPEDS